MSAHYVLGITGGSASGKTRVLAELMNNFNANEIVLLSQDNYYKPIHEQPIDANGVENFDTPKSIDCKAFAADIEALKSGRSVERKEYTFNNNESEPKVLRFAPAPIIVVEGIFVFFYEMIAKQMDLKVFIDAAEHIKLKRRIIRDNEERGYDLDDVLYRYEAHVFPSYERYIEPYKNDADIVIPNNKDYTKGLEVVSNHLKTVLKK